MARAIADAHSRSTIDMVASTSSGVPSSSTSSVQRVPSPPRPDAADSAASYSRSTAGVAPAWRILRHASMPSANDSQVYAARRSWDGRRWVRSHAVVTMPSVPSEPMNSCDRSGPTAAAGAPPVRTTRPSASTTSRPTTIDSILP